jgi:RND superfamily putative drug exporter
MADDPAVVQPLVEAIRADPGIASVGAPEVYPAAGVAVVTAIPTTGPQEAATHATVERLRAEVLPKVLAGSPAQAHVGGQTANFADVGARVNERLPVLLAAVLTLSFVLLMFVFRSVLVPLKAVVLNLLSIGAAYGVMVMVFQWGWGGGLIGLQSTVPIVSFIPMFMFAILFGLSMDYEVFLLSRIREEYLRSGDNGLAVADGLAATARVITAAAAIMVFVFGVFIFDPNTFVKQIGLGLTAAVLVDATIVRMVLVPATMELLGNANWWMPRWLARLLPEIHIDSEAAVEAELVALLEAEKASA